MKRVVFVDFGLRPERVRAAQYAASIVSVLGCELMLRIDEAQRIDQDMFQCAAQERIELDPKTFLIANQATHVGRKLVEGGLYVAAYPDTARLDSLERGTHVLFSHDETSLARRKDQGIKIALPFGDQKDAALANLAALRPIAQALGATIVGVHATYRDPRIKSEEPQKHMNRAARETQDTLAAFALGARIEFSTRVGMGVDLVPFVSNAANELGCNLIAVAPGRALRDSYAHEVERTTNLPTLMLSTEGGAR